MKTVAPLFILLFLSSFVSVDYLPHIIKITQKHHAIAVLPPRTTIERKIWMTDDRFNELTLQKQSQLQEQLIRSFARRMNEGKCFVEVLDINYTNDIVLPAGYNEGRISPKELCKLLKVDAVLESNVQILEPVSEATAIFFQQATATKRVWSVSSTRTIKVPWCFFANK
jgi:adenylate kinase